MRDAVHPDRLYLTRSKENYAMKQGAGSRATKIVFLIAAVLTAVGCSGGSSNPAASASAVVKKKTFVTAATYNGDIKTAGGKANAIASADSLCMADANKPAGGGTYKAMLSDITTRAACTTPNCIFTYNDGIDWVMQANAIYTRSDGTTVVMTTGPSGIWDFVNPNTDPRKLPATFDTTGTTYWTGLDWDWRATQTGSFCGYWSNGTSGVNGDFGSGDKADDLAIGGGSSGCDVARHLLCIEQ